MRLTPLDIRQQQFRRVMRGIDPEEVEQFLSTVAGEFESLVASNNELRQRVLELEEKVVEYRNMEKALRDALLAAEKVMGEAKDSAQREAALIVREAELAAERARGRLANEMHRLQDELSGVRRLKDGYVARVRWLLRSHLEFLDGHATEFADLEPPGGRTPAPPGGPRLAVDATAGWALPERHERPRPEPAAPPVPEADPWAAPPLRPSPPGGLEDVLRPVAPDGSYERPVPPPVPSTPEEIAQAARRAERLAAEARAALERHGALPSAPRHPPDGEWGPDVGVKP